MATPYSLRLTYVSQSSAGGSGDRALDDPVAPPGSNDPSDDPRPEELNGDWLRLEQTPFEEPPAGGFSKWLVDNALELTLANVTEYQDRYQSLCGEDSSLEVGIQVHKSRAALAYKLIASYGTLSQVSAGESDKVESRSIEAGDEIDLQSNVDGDAEVAWEGPVYDKNGVQLDQPPTVTQASGKLSLSQPVTGTIRASYTATYDKYTLVIVPRDAANSDPNDKGSAYQSTIMAFWGNGHVESLSVSMPSMTGNCGNTDSDSDDEGEDEEYDGECYDLYIKYQKCTGEEISRELKRVKCPEQVQAECEDACNDGPEADREQCLEGCR